jgi:hypothetical protein
LYECVDNFFVHFDIYLIFVRRKKQTMETEEATSPSDWIAEADVTLPVVLMVCKSQHETAGMTWGGGVCCIHLRCVWSPAQALGFGLPHAEGASPGADDDESLPRVLNVYQLGSRVYHTAEAGSDWYCRCWSVLHRGACRSSLCAIARHWH